MTNYVLWELGQPLHAFDYATVADSTIVVRRARAGERFTTLDGQERALDASMLLIADPQRAIGLAGVMGGANTEVTAGTTRVLLESAWFAPASIRRTSRALGLRTDAAYRFERGADIEGLVTASARAAALIAEIAGGTIARGMIDAYPRKRKPQHVRLRMSRVKRVLGIAPSAAQARKLLAGLGLPVKSPRRRSRGRPCRASGATSRWRTISSRRSSVSGATTGSRRRCRAARSRSSSIRPPCVRARPFDGALVGAGLAEVVTYAFTDPAKAELLRRTVDPEPVELLNPLARTRHCCA